MLAGDELTPAENEWLAEHFREQILPVLTPQAIDPSHPFPFIPNGGFSLIFDLQQAKRAEPVVELLVDAHDADQITLGDLRALQQADVVLFDAGIAPEIVDLARRDAMRAVWQDQEILAGQRVVRLKARATAGRGQFKVM